MVAKTYVLMYLYVYVTVLQEQLRSSVYLRSHR